MKVLGVFGQFGLRKMKMGNSTLLRRGFAVGDPAKDGQQSTQSPPVPPSSSATQSSNPTGSVAGAAAAAVAAGIQAKNMYMITRKEIQEQLKSFSNDINKFYKSHEATSQKEQNIVKEEHLSTLLNTRILRREFLNDGLGISLKALSLYTATSG